MIDCIFTLDYEIYGNGTGSLNDVVLEPGEKLREIFEKWDARFVNFVEVAELEQIERHNSDAAIGRVKRQVRELHEKGFEIALHLHPQWCNARYQSGQWMLDLAEYNLCELSAGRIGEIVDRSIDYLRTITGQGDFTPLSFRAGNWLFQPTQRAACVLSQRGIKVDSSVFKGGVQRNNALDYRPALQNGYYWAFDADVNQPQPSGAWVEVPIYTEMVPVWRMVTSKRVGLATPFRPMGRVSRER